MGQPVHLADIKALSVDERIALVQAIWDTIAAEVEPHGPIDEETSELDLRIADLDTKPNDVVTWERIKAHVRSHP
jgi:putative addiction module component (TIGR02574 family)